jgi:predicted Rossmann fold flavoprotein
MKYDILVIGGGASGLMAAYSAASTAADKGRDLRVCVLEKMPRPGRKIMITGKGRCNFTNMKDWNAFSAHVRSGSKFLRSAFYSLPPERLEAFFNGYGMESVVERGDRAFPASHRSADVVDTLVRACQGVGVIIETEAEVEEIRHSREDTLFTVQLTGGRSHSAPKLIVATGGLSYPGTGSTGDGLRWARELGHTVTPLFPSLTALVPRGYKDAEGRGPRHIPRETPMTEFGQKLCGIQLKNVGASLLVQDTVAGSEFGDIDFTDGGLEGPLGFQLSRKAVKSLTNGSRVAITLDLKPGVSLTELTTRVKELWEEIAHDPRSARIREKERCRILLGKLMPWELIPAFTAAHPGIITLERRGRADTKVWINLVTIAKALKEWRFDIDGYVGWERAVITAGGVSLDDVVPKTMESRLVPGLYFCGETLDIDADTGGYNLQLAFCTGNLAGISAAGVF